MALTVLLIMSTQWVCDKAFRQAFGGTKTVLPIRTIALIAIALVALVVLVGVWRLRIPKPIDRTEKEYREIH